MSTASERPKAVRRFLLDQGFPKPVVAIDQLDRSVSYVALALNRNLSFVTWKTSIEDPLTEWGQLMAYMPLVLRWIEEKGAHIFWLPKPTLESKSTIRARARAGQLASEGSMSYPELLAEARGTMRAELQNRKLLDRLGGLAGVG